MNRPLATLVFLLASAPAAANFVGIFVLTMLSTHQDLQHSDPVPLQLDWPEHPLYWLPRPDRRDTAASRNVRITLMNPLWVRFAERYATVVRTVWDSSCEPYPQRSSVVVVSRVGLILADIIGVAVTVAKTRQGEKAPPLGGSQRSLGNVLLYDGTPPLSYIPCPGAPVDAARSQG